MTQSADLGAVPNAEYGISVRQGLNLSDEALASMSAGPSAPPTTYPCMLWHDTALHQIKQRDEANTSWRVLVVFAATAPGVGDDAADLMITGTLWADATGKKVYVCKDPAAGAAVWVEIGSGAGATALTVYDEATSLGTTATLKFVGAGVTATVDGAAVVATIPAATAAAGGDNTTVQFNNSSAIAGAAGIKVKSPTNGVGKSNHVLHASTYTGDLYTATVAAGASFWVDSAHSVAFYLSLEGACTLKGSNLSVANNGEIATSKVYLKNTTGSAVNVTIDQTTGHFTEVIGLTNPVSVPANSTKIVFLTCRKDSSGNVARAIEG